MTSTNRFRALAQDFIEENKDILTLPEGAGEAPEVNVEEPAGNLQSEQSDIQFPAVDWNFYIESDPTTFSDDVVALIEHLASLQVSMDVLDKAVSLIQENQNKDMINDPNENQMEDLSVGVAPPEPNSSPMQPMP